MIILTTPILLNGETCNILPFDTSTHTHTYFRYANPTITQVNMA